MRKVNLDYSNIFKFVDKNEFNNMKNLTENFAQKLHSKTGAGNDFLGG